MVRTLLTLALPVAMAIAGPPVTAFAQAQDKAAAQAPLQDADSIAVPPPAARYSSEARIVPFELFRGTRMFLSGSINGTRTEMMLDTGASSTVLDTAFARSLGIAGDRKLAIRGAGGSTPGELASGITIAVGSMTLTDASVLIMDLSPIAAAIGRPIPAILGHEAIDAGPVRIDFPARTMTFMPAAGFVPPAGATELALGHDGPFRSVKVSIGALPAVDATFDLGNGGAIVLAKSYWETQPELAKIRGAETLLGGVGGLKPGRRVMLPRVEFAGRTLEAVPAVFNLDGEALPTEGANVGIEMLKPFVVTANYAKDRLYLEASDAWTGFRKERAGVMTQHRGDRLHIQFASADGPAAAAGLKAGDEIVAINGKKIGADFYGSPEAEWAVAPAGTPVVMTRADGSEVTVTLRDYY